MQSHFLKRVNAQKLQSSVQSSRQAKFLVNDGDHKVNAHRDPDLSLHRIGACPVVMLDAQVAFDPAEEQLDAPAQPVDLCDGQRRDCEVVGQEDQIPLRLGVEVAHLSQKVREGFSCFGQSGFADLVAAQAARVIHRKGTLPGEAQVVFGSRDKERSGACDQIQAFEIHVTAVHDVEGSRFEEEIVEPTNVVLAGIGDVNAGGNRTAQIDLGMHLDSRLGSAEVGPREECQGEVDSRGVQCIDRVGQFQAKIFSCVERSGFSHQNLGQVFPKSPVPLLVGVGKRRFGYRFAKTQMVKSLRLGVQTSGNIPQSLAPGQLGECHADELLAAAKMPDARFRIVAFHQTEKHLAIYQIQNLRKNEAAGIHGPKSCSESPQNSNAWHYFSCANCSKIDFNNN